MPKISICTCNVALGGDLNNVVHKGELDPVTWPETEVLMHLHGEPSVTDIRVIGTRATTVEEEMERLTLKYGAKATKELFPGKRPAMQLAAPPGVKRVTLKADVETDDAGEVADKPLLPAAGDEGDGD